MSKHRPKFPLILYSILDDAEEKNFEWIISWLPNSSMFKIHDPAMFIELIMKQYFPAQHQYKSFLRQLNLYHFQRMLQGLFRGAYTHRLFVRGRRDLCMHINRDTLPATRVPPTGLMTQPLDVELRTSTILSDCQIHRIDFRKECGSHRRYFNNTKERALQSVGAHRGSQEKEMPATRVTRTNIGSYEKRIVQNAPNSIPEIMVDDIIVMFGTKNILNIAANLSHSTCLESMKHGES